MRDAHVGAIAEQEVSEFLRPDEPLPVCYLVAATRTAVVEAIQGNGLRSASRAFRRHIYRNADHLSNTAEVDVLSQQGGTAPPCDRRDQAVDQTPGCNARSPAPSVYPLGRLEVRRWVDRHQLEPQQQPA